MKQNQIWDNQHINMKRCGIAFVAANAKGVVLPDEIYARMYRDFTSEEIEAIEAYVVLKSLNPFIAGLDHLTTEQMNEKIKQEEI